ncbi:SRPBCC domain-containing protein [Parafrigoribacterium mesophilum]|uniref:SRPBCC family protein n=1 Tax=Parafrigoribacterium mesophilum TaxID=433646 RepID=UPI0031FC0BDA
MTVLSSHKDPDALTLTIVAEFDASVERVWQVWEDPRQLERWWGPPTWPATFERHDFTVGGQSHYYMTGPDGEKARGWWTATVIDPPRRFEYDDGFSGNDGQPDPSLPTMHGVVTLDEVGGKTRMTTVTEFVSTEQLEQVLAMGMEEGMVGAMGQIDAVLADQTRQGVGV